MLPRDVLTTAFLLASTLATGRAFLLPLLFPVSIKITIHSNRKPPPPKPDYHFSTVPVYKEVVVKGSAHISNPGYKHSYGDGHKYGTSYGDGHVKVYTDEPHIKGHKYAKGYGTGSAVHFPGPTATHYKGTPHQHYQGAEYAGVPETHYVQEPEHYKGTDYVLPQGHLKGTEYIQPEGHHKGTEYIQPEGHHKGTEYIQPEGHHKGTDYTLPQGHHKGTEYIQPEGHHKGTDYTLPQGHPKGTEYVLGGHQTGVKYVQPDIHHKGGKKVYKKDHSYIKSVGGYKMSDYFPYNDEQQGYDNKANGYVSHVAIPSKVEPGHTYANIAAAHKEVHAPKAYAAKEYADLGAHQYRPVQDYSDESGYLDDSLPAYKYPPTRQYSSREGRTAPIAAESTSYAGFGTSIYGDSYAKVMYQPKNLRISIRAYRH